MFITYSQAEGEDETVGETLSGGEKQMVAIGRGSCPDRACACSTSRLTALREGGSGDFKVIKQLPEKESRSYS